MAGTQTTTAYSAVSAKIEFSTDGSSWTDISGEANKLEGTEQTRQADHDYTFAGDYGIITGGKFDPLDIKVTALHTPTSGQIWKVINAAFTAKSAAYVRWSPQGGASGTLRYTSDVGVVTGCMWPNMDASSPKPNPASFTIRVPKVTETTVP